MSTAELGSRKRIGILVVAYNAASTLTATLDRIPESLHDQLEVVIVSDDCSADDTYEVGLNYQQNSSLPILMIRQPVNLGYGGNQKAGYRMAIEMGLDIVVLLHGDGQYAPEAMPEILAPLLAEEADAVFGSRMMERGGALRGGMPLYKFVGNKILTRFENLALGSHLSEFHSGYRAYSIAALKDIAFERNSDGFNFDTQIIIQLHDQQKKITEIPIPTYYGDEICYVDGMAYAKDVTKDVISYRLQRLGFGDGSRITLSHEYQLKPSEHSSHGRIIDLMRQRPADKVLDLGCSSGLVAEQLRELGHHVTGVDYIADPRIGERVDVFYEADLNQGIPTEAGSGFSCVLAADVLEHLVRPRHLLEQMSNVVDPSGTVILSVPNFGHWYPRFRVLFGKFGYDQRGILDATHLCFFTRASIKKLVVKSGFEIVHVTQAGMPFDVLGLTARVLAPVRGMDRFLARIWPSMFSYQTIIEARPLPKPN